MEDDWVFEESYQQMNKSEVTHVFYYKISLYIYIFFLLPQGVSTVSQMFCIAAWFIFDSLIDYLDPH